MTIHSVQIQGKRLTPNQPSLTGVDPVWVRVRPGLRRGAAIASDALTAMGKNLTLHGHGRNEHEDIRIAAAWMKARGIRDLILWDANELTVRTLPTAIELANNSEVNLWLVYGGPTTDTLLRKLDAFPRKDVQDLPRTVTHPPKDPQFVWNLGPPVDARFFQFRTIAMENCPLQVVTFDQQLSTTASCLDQATDPNVALHDALAKVLLDSHSDATLLARLKAIQAAAWNHDIYVKIDFARVLNSPERPRQTLRETDRILLNYRQPLRAIAVALTLRGIDLSTLNSITIKDVTDEGYLPAILPTWLHSTALRIALLAQKHLRCLQGASPPEALVNLAPRTLSTYVRQTAADLGIHAHGRRVLTSRQRNTWLRSLGINLISLP